MKLKLVRAKSRFYDESKFRIFINGQQVAKLQENESVEVEIPAHRVEIEAKLNFCGSKKFTFEAQEELEVRFDSNYKIRKNVVALVAPFPLLLVFFINAELVWLKVLSSALLIALIALNFYVMVIARKRWIFIEAS